MKGSDLIKRRWTVSALLAALLLTVLTLSAFFTMKAAPAANAVTWDGEVADWYSPGTQAFDTANSTATDKGTAANPYVIYNGGQLALLGTLVVTDAHYGTAHYHLRSNIVLNDTSNLAEWGTYADETAAEAAGINPWTPIGKADNGIDRGFAGIFDGGGFTVSGIYINSTADNLGLFTLLDGEVKNLTVADGLIRGQGVDDGDGNITGGNYVGGIAGQIGYGAQVLNCVNTADVEGTQSVGGIAGQMSDAAQAEACKNSGDVTGNYYVGGIAGYSSSTETLFACANSGAVTGRDLVGNRSGQIGGIVGQLEGGTAEKCVNNGTVIGDGYVGGIVGYFSSTETLLACTNSGAVTGRDAKNVDGNITGGSSVGGIAGGISSGAIMNCDNTGAVDGDGSVGGIAGDVWGNSSVANCMNSGAIGGNTFVGGVVGFVVGNTPPVTVVNCLNSGAVIGDGIAEHIGGIAGGVMLLSFSFENCYYLQTAEVNAGLETVGRDAPDSTDPTDPDPWDPTFLEDCFAFGANGVLAGAASVTVDGAQYTTALGALNAWVIAENTATPGTYYYFTMEALSEDCPHYGTEWIGHYTAPTLTTVGQLSGTCPSCGVVTRELPTLLTEDAYTYGSDEGKTRCVYRTENSVYAFYFTAAELFEYANTAGAADVVKIKLLSDMAAGENITLTGNIELDLNGKTLTMDKIVGGSITDRYTVKLTGNLTVKDSVGGGKITGSTVFLIQLIGAGTITVDGGIIEATHDRGYAIYNDDGTGDVTINDGTVKAKGNAIVCYPQSSGNITVNGGTVTGNIVANYASIAHFGTGNITINDGTVSAAGGFAVNRKGSGALSINGGTVSATGAEVIAVYVSGTGAVTVGNTDVGVAARKVVLTSEYSRANYGTVFIANEADGAAFTVQNNVEIKNTATGGIAIHNKSLKNIEITGGTVSASGAGGKAISNSAGNVTVSGGAVVSASGADGVAIENMGEGDIIVSSGTVSASGARGTAISNGAGNLTVSGGTVLATENEGVAIVNHGTGTVTIGNDAPESDTADKATVTSACTHYQKGTVYLTNQTVTGTVLTVKNNARLENVAGGGTYSSVIYNNSSGDVTVSGGTVTMSSTLSRGIFNYSTGKVTVTGGEIAVEDGFAIANYVGGEIAIEGGTVSATGAGGIAIYNYSTGGITIGNDAAESDTAVKATVTSENSGTDYGTVLLDGGTGGNTILTVKNNARIDNTSTIGGNVVRNRKAGNIAVSGGTVTSAGNDIVVISNTDAGNVTVSGGTVSATGESAIAISNIAGGNVTVSGTATVSATGADGKAINNAQGGDITVSGTAAVSAGDGRAIYNQNTGGVTVEGDATVSATIGYAIYNEGAGEVAVSGGTVSVSGKDGIAIYNRRDGNVRVEGDATVSATGEEGYAIYNEDTGEVTVSGDAKVSAGNGRAIDNNGSGDVTVSGDATVSATIGYAIYNESTGEVTVSGGTVKVTGKAGIAINNAGGDNSITVSGGMVTATVENGIAINNGQNGSITVSGTAAVSATNFYAINNNGSGNVTVSDTATVFVTTGRAISNWGEGNVRVSGGAVSAATGYAIYTHTVGTVIIGNDEEESDTAVKATVTSESNDGTVYFLNNANAAGKDVLTIKNNAYIDNTATGRSIRNGGPGNIVMFGGTVSASGGLAIYNANEGNVTISGGNVSSVGGTAIYNADKGNVTVSGTGTVSSVGDTAIYNADKGNVTVSGTGTVSASGARGIAIHNNQNGHVTVSGDAAVSANYYAIYNNAKEGSVAVTGGTVSSDDGIAICNNAGGSIAVSGNGTVTSATGTAIHNNAGGNVAVSGGTVSVGGASGIAINDASNVTVSGGTVSATGKDGNAISVALSAVVIVSGTGTVSASGEGGIAINGAGDVTVSDTGTVLAANTAIFSTGMTAVVTVTGGTVSAGNSAVRGSFVMITVSGGTVSATGAGGVAIEGMAGGNITVAGGTVSATGEGGIAIDNMAGGNVIVSGTGTVSATGEGGIAIHNIAGGVTVAGGTVTATGGIAIDNTDGGYVVVLDTGTVTGEGGIAINNLADGNIKIADGTVSATGAGGIAISNLGGGNVMIEGGTVSATTGYAIYNFGSGDVAVLGGEVSAGNGNAIYNSGSGNVTILDGEVSADGTAIYNFSGLITIGNDLDESDTALKAVVTSLNSKGAEAAIMLMDHEDARGKTVLIIKNNALIDNTVGITIRNGGEGNILMTGGAVTSTGQYCSAIYNISKGTVTVAGGTVTGGTTDKNVRGITNNDEGTVLITGGTVQATGSGLAIFNVAMGTVIVSGGTVSAVEKAIQNSKGSLIIGNDEEESVTALKATVTSQNAYIAEGTIFIYLDANAEGKTVLTIKNNAFISATGDRNAVCNKGPGNILMTGGVVTAVEGYAIYNANTGTVTVSGGTVSAGSGTAIYGYGAGNITVTGGTVTAGKYAIFNASTGVVTVRQVGAETPTRIEVTGGESAAVIKLSVTNGETAVLVLYGEYLYKIGAATFIENPDNATVQIYAELTAPANINKTYDGKVATATATLDGNFVPVWAWSLNGGEVSDNANLSVLNAGDSGTYTVTATVSAYGYSTDYSAEITVAIAKDVPVVTAPTAISGEVHPGVMQALITAGSTSAGTLLYALGDGEYSETLPTAAQAGEYTVKYKVLGNGNYEDVAEVSLTVTLTAVAHSFGAWEKGVDPTAAAAGNLVRTCSHGDCSATDTHSLAAFNDSDYGYAVKTPAACGTEGSATYTYSGVKDAGGNPFVFTVVLPALEHRLAAVAAVAATFTAPGNKAYWTCSDCDCCFEDAAATKLTTSDAMATPVRTDYTITPSAGSNVASDFFNGYVLGERFKLQSREGYIFIGWYLDAEFTQKVTSVTAADIPDDGTLILYAKWEPVGSDGLSGGAIAGIVIGSVVVAAVAGFAVFWFAIRKKSFSDLLAVFKKGKAE